MDRLKFRKSPQVDRLDSKNSSWTTSLCTSERKGPREASFANLTSGVGSGQGDGGSDDTLPASRDSTSSTPCRVTPHLSTLQKSAAASSCNQSGHSPTSEFDLRHCSPIILPQQPLTLARFQLHGKTPSTASGPSALVLPCPRNLDPTYITTRALKVTPLRFRRYNTYCYI